MFRIRPALILRSMFLVILLLSLAVESRGFAIFKPVETVLHEKTDPPQTLNGVPEMPGKLKDDPTAKGFRITRGKLPYMQFLFDYDVELDKLPMKFNLTQPNLEDESYSTMVHSCLLSPHGIEYQGRMFYTTSKNVCINWNHPLLYEKMKIKPFVSKDFPDESISDAASYCRNPDNSPVPWCFRKKDKKRENCSIPFCDRKKCILTGPGLEYRGTLNRSIYGDCEPWSFDVPIEQISSAKAFAVKNYCRNPTYDPAGPYCYVHQHYHDSGAYPWLIKSYCDIPLCDLYFNAPTYKGELYFRKRGPYLFCSAGKHVDYYTHYTLINSERNYLNVSLKLWNPATVFNDQVRIVLSVLAIPANSSEFLRWNMGFEIVLSNNKTGVIVNPPEDSILIPIPGLLSGIRWTHLTIEWDEGGIYVNSTRDDESTSIYRFKEPNLADTIRGLYKNKIQYFSVLGSTALMRIIYPDGGGCEEQITTEEIFSRYYPFFRDGPVKKLQFAVKTTMSCFLIMKVSPLNISVAEAVVSLNGRGNSRLILRTYQNFTYAGRELVEEILQEVETVGDITLSNWTFFSLSIRASTLRLSMHSPLGSIYLFDYKNIHFSSLRYYSIASASVAHWTLGCPPDDVKIEPYLPPNRDRPECSSTINDMDYKGQISVSEKGRACLPWISDFVTTIEKMYVDNHTYEAVNYCRNVVEKSSAYCYVYDRLANRTVKREHCSIPKCEIKRCRAYGTGVGNWLNISTTISGRDCKFWDRADEKFKSMFHADENVSEYKRHLLDAIFSENFCRNPNNDISGPWCCTTDPNMEVELCDIPDCDRPFETITLLTNNVIHETYIKPSWRVTGWKFWIKRWERNIDSGLIVTLQPANKTEYFRIIFEGKNTSRVLLVYGNQKEKPVEVERYAAYDFYLFIPNNWTGYCLTIKPERLILGIVGEKFPFIDWEYSLLFERLLGGGPTRQFTPHFLSFEKTYTGVLAMSFDPTDPFVEILTSEEQATYYPITYGKKGSAYLPANVITFHFRGNGNAFISFYNAIWMGPVMTIEIGGGELDDRFLSKMYDHGNQIPLEVNRTEGPSILNSKWTEFRISMTEEQIIVYRDDDVFSSWKNPKPFLAYHFRLRTNENITWITNSNPPEMDAKPVDGGWSDWLSWDCSATCGGGRGFRERLCTSPSPSLFGTPCRGEPIEYGLCNVFSCDDLSPDIVEAINDRMRRYLHSRTVYQHTNSVEIGCYPDILEIIQEHSPNFLVYWDRNGVAISDKIPIRDIHADRFSWVKMEAEVNDSGVYSCVIETPIVKFRPVQITSLIVKTESSYTFVGFTGEIFKFRSNNNVLAWIYKDLVLIWLHDGQPSYKYTEIYLPLVNTKDVVLEMDDAGVWECTIQNKKFNMKWHTNWVRIKVKYRNDFVKYLMDDNNYTRHIFKNFEPIYVEISFAILVIVAAAITLGFAILMVYCQRLLTKQWKDLYRVIQEKLRGESPYQGNMPHTSSESNFQKADSSDSSMSSGYRRYIQKDKDPTIYYVTDEYVSVSDSRDHLGLKPKKIKRKLLRDIGTAYKHRRLPGVKREKSHKDSNVRRAIVKIRNLSYAKTMMRREEEARRDEMLDESSSSTSKIIYDTDPDPVMIMKYDTDPKDYNEIYPRPFDLLNYERNSHNVIDTVPIETPTPDIHKERHSRKKLNESKLLSSEKEQSVNHETKKNKAQDHETKKNKAQSPFANFAGKSQFHREPYKPNKEALYWKKLAELKELQSNDSEYSFDSDSYSGDMDSIVLASTDSELS